MCLRGNLKLERVLGMSRASIENRSRIIYCGSSRSIVTPMTMEVAVVHSVGGRK